MKIVYDTRSGLGKKFAEKTHFETQSVYDPIAEPCILVTRNVGLGLVPKSTKAFLDANAAWVQGVVVNGDKRYGVFFCGAASKIEKEYRIPVLLKIEGEGTDADVQTLLEMLAHD